MQYGGPAEVAEGTSNDWNLNKDLLDLPFVWVCVWLARVCTPGSDASLILDHNTGWVAVQANSIYWFPGRSISVAAAVSCRIRFSLQLRGKSLKIFNISSHFIPELNKSGTAGYPDGCFFPKMFFFSTAFSQRLWLFASTMLASQQAG